MKFINRYIAFAAVLAMLFSSCSKDETTTTSDDPNVQSVDLTFGAVLNDLVNRAPSVNKNHFADIPDCSGADPAYVELEISYPGQAPEDMGVITVNILSEGGDFFTDYTEDLKIPVPNNSSVTVTLESFIVFDSEGNRIWIAPIAPEDDPDLFEGYVDNPLEFDFVVQDGTKPYIDVEVLCYDRRVANEYGYVFFDVVPEKIYPFCLFINYCNEDGRHYVANYTVDLYYGTDDSGIQLYDGANLNEDQYGMVSGNYYSDPLCLVVPGKPMSLADTDPYLTLIIHPNDWENNYGDIDNSPITVQVTWEMVNGLLNADGETNEYWHGIIGECEGALTGDGSGGNGGGNGGTECDPNDPDADCDDDGTLNKCDTDNVNWAVFDCDGDEVSNGQDLCPGTLANTEVDADGCDINNGGDDCEWTIVDPSGENCYRTTLLNAGDSFTQVDVFSGIPLLDTDGLAAGNFGISSVNGGIEYNFDIGGNTVPEYVIQITDTEGGTIYCSDQADDNNIVEGTFTLPVYIRVAANICEPNE